MWLLWAELWYNTSYHTASKVTPFQAVYERESLTLIRFDKGTTPVSIVEQQLMEWDQVLEELKNQLSRAQAIMKRGADRKKRDV